MEKLQIAFDGKRAVRNSTGLGNYSRYAIEALSATYPGHDYAVMSPGGSASRLASVLERPNVSLVEPSKAIDRRFGALWRTFDITGQLADMGVDIYHGLSNELPLNIRRIPSLASVVTIHDLIWRRCPKDYKAMDRAIYDYKYRHSAINATRIIAISRCTRDDLVNDYGIDPAKIDIVYQGVDATFVPAGEYDRIDIRRRYNLPERYIIGVGTIQARKNQHSIYSRHRPIRRRAWPARPSAHPRRYTLCRPSGAIQRRHMCRLPLALRGLRTASGRGPELRNSGGCRHRQLPRRSRWSRSNVR